MKIREAGYNFGYRLGWLLCGYKTPLNFRDDPPKPIYRDVRKLDRTERFVAWLIAKLDRWLENYKETKWVDHEARYQQQREQQHVDSYARLCERRRQVDS